MKKRSIGFIMFTMFLVVLILSNEQASYAAGEDTVPHMYCDSGE